MNKESNPPAGGKNLESFKHQSGVTLLLATLILSGLTLVILAIASFAIQEIRASRAIVATQPAISAAESAGEQGIWAIKRSGTLPPMCNPATPPSPQSLGTNTVSTSCLTYSNATFELTGGTPLVFYLYNPTDINGDVDLSEFDYDWVRVTHKSGTSTVSVNIARIDGTTVGPQPATVSTGGGFQQIDIPNVSSGSEGRMTVTLGSSSNTTVQVDTNRGLPAFPTVDATGCSARGTVSSCTSGQEIFSRRINVTVPQ